MTPQECKLIPYVHKSGSVSVQYRDQHLCHWHRQGIERALSEFPAHTSLGGAVNTLEERNTSQGGFDTLERWVSATVTEFYKVHGPALEPWQSHSYRLGVGKGLRAALQRRIWQ